jgi:flagellar hook assembly protein FlgD
VNELPINANTISVFPNPTANVSNLVIDLKSNANVNVNIVNGIGQVVKSFDFGFATAGSNSFSMDLSTLSTGIYVIQMNIGGEVATRVLSIQK